MAHAAFFSCLLSFVCGRIGSVQVSQTKKHEEITAKRLLPLIPNSLPSAIQEGKNAQTLLKLTSLVFPVIRSMHGWE